MLFQEAEPFLICPSMEKEDAKNAGWDFEIIGYSDIENPWELVQNTIQKRITKVSRVAIEKEHMNVERFEALSSLFPDAAFYISRRKLASITNDQR